MEVHDITKRIFFITFGIAFVSLCIGLFVASDRWEFAAGITLGTLFSVGRMLLLERNVRRSLDMEAENAQNYMRVNFALRYVLTFAVLALFAITPWISIWGAIIGIFAMQVAIYIVNFRLKNKAS